MSEIYVVYEYSDPFNAHVVYVGPTEYDARQMIKVLQNFDRRADYYIKHYIEDKDY